MLYQEIANTDTSMTIYSVRLIVTIECAASLYLDVCHAIIMFFCVCAVTTVRDQDARVWVGDAVRKQYTS